MLRRQDHFKLGRVGDATRLCVIYLGYIVRMLVLMRDNTVGSTTYMDVNKFQNDSSAYIEP